MITLSDPSTRIDLIRITHQSAAYTTGPLFSLHFNRQTRSKMGHTIAQCNVSVKYIFTPLLFKLLNMKFIYLLIFVTLNFITRNRLMLYINLDIPN